MTIAESMHSHIVEPHAARESPVIKPLFDRKNIRAGQYEARSGMEPLEKPPNYYNNYSSYTSFAERDDVGAFKRNKSSFHAVTTNYHEQSSLFSKTDAGRVADINAARLRADKVIGFPKPLVESETAFMWSLSAQLLLSNVIDFMPGFISGVLMGHLSTAYSSELIAAKSISNIFMMITGYTINIAVGAAMDTLCAQAYGAGKLHEMGLFFQTGLLLFMICFIPVLIITYFCVDILVLLGQNPDIALLARNLVWYSIPSLPFSMVNALFCKILQGQNMIKPMVYAGLVGNIVHGIVIYSLMFHTSMGYLGSSIASSALIMCYTLTLCTYFYQSHLYQREWPGWKLYDAMKLVPEFIKLGVSGLGMIMFESWAFSAVTLFAGALPVGDVAVSADSTYSSFRVMCALFYGTVAMVGSVRVGNALGANDPQRAKFAAYFSIGLCVVVALLSSFVMLMLRNTYPYAYTNDERVVSLTSTLMLLTCPFQVFAGISAVGQGIMRGSGMQGLGARVNFIAYMVCAIPIGLTFAYQFEMGLLGLWLGLCSGFVCSGMYCLYWLLHANWTELAIDAQKRTREPCERSPETNSSSTFV